MDELSASRRRVGSEWCCRRASSCCSLSLLDHDATGAHLARRPVPPRPQTVPARSSRTSAPTTSVAPTTSTTAPATTVTTAAVHTVAASRSTAALHPVTRDRRRRPPPPPSRSPSPPTTTAAPAPTDPGRRPRPFLACIRQRESHGNYAAVSANGIYRGAYQFSQASWDSTARHAGRPIWSGSLANLVSPGRPGRRGPHRSTSGRARRPGAAPAADRGNRGPRASPQRAVDLGSSPGRAS